MIHYHNSKNYIKRKGTKVALSDFKGVNERNIDVHLPVSYAPYIAGYKCRDGRLATGLGVSPMTDQNGVEVVASPMPIDNIFVYRFHDVEKIFISCDHNCFRLNTETKKWELEPAIFPSGQDAVMFTIDEDPSIIIPKQDGGLYRYNGYGFYTLKLSYNIVTMCTHMNRLFLVDKGDEYRLRFSEVNDPNNFNISLEEGGEIYLDVEDGKILRLISHNGNLYIFREHAIYRLTAYGDQREFNLKKICTINSRVIKDSIALCGNEFIFLTTSGAFSFDGYSTKPTFLRLEKMLSQVKGNVRSCYFDGKYYLAFTKDDVPTVNNMLLEYDLMQDSATLALDVNIGNFKVLSGVDGMDRLMVSCDNMKRIGIVDNSGSYYGERLPKVWKSAEISDGIYDNKKELIGFTCHKDDRYDLYISADGGLAHKYMIDGKARYYRVNMRGYYFTFEIRSHGDRDIHSPILEVKVLS